ncbi:hypothetical protein, partial [Treponema bryantii]|uniref:hypothetical protein n=1 Tax=Treponema bryantii TaxID=163 RepID=UPI001C43671A
QGCDKFLRSKNEEPGAPWGITFSVLPSLGPAIPGTPYHSLSNCSPAAYGLFQRECSGITHSENKNPYILSPF